MELGDVRPRARFLTRGPPPSFHAQSFVFIKRVTDASFSPLDTSGVASRSIGHLVRLACTELKWGESPTQFSLYRIPSDRAHAVERDASTAEDLLRGDSIFSGATLPDAGVVTGSFLLARIKPVLSIGARALPRPPASSPLPPHAPRPSLARSQMLVGPLAAQLWQTVWQRRATHL